MLCGSTRNVFTANQKVTISVFPSDRKRCEMCFRETGNDTKSICDTHCSSLPLSNTKYIRSCTRTHRVTAQPHQRTSTPPHHRTPHPSTYIQIHELFQRLNNRSPVHTFVELAHTCDSLASWSTLIAIQQLETGAHQTRCHTAGSNKLWSAVHSNESIKTTLSHQHNTLWHTALARTGGNPMDEKLEKRVTTQ